MVLCLFFCVVLHEFGHALTARRYGVETEDIILLPIGGVARLRNMPDKPIQELVIAIMGPAVNLVIAIVLFIVILSLNQFEFSSLENILNINPESFSSLIPLLFIANIFLILFNMVPAFPMDGGRVLRALFAMKFGKLQATKWASILGRILCVIFIILGIYFEYYFWIMIGIFIFISALGEYNAVKLDYKYKNKTVRDALFQEFKPLIEYQSISDARREIENTEQHNFLVININGQQVGTISRKKILKSAPSNDAMLIASIMNPALVSIAPDLPLLHAFFTLSQGLDLLIVTQDNQVIGLVDHQSIEAASNVL